MARLTNEVVLITGGASGLGRAIVDRFVDEGARVAVMDRSEAGLATLNEDHGKRIRTTAGDVRSMQSVGAAVESTVDDFGKLDCVIGNAGLWDYSTRLDDIPADTLADAFDELFGVNVLGYLTLAKASIPHLARSEGSIIYTVSNAGFHPAGGGALYTASKHAVVGLIRQLAYELAPAIRVNGVAPGPIHSQLRGPESMGLAQRTIDQLDLPGNAGPNMAIGRVPAAAEYAASYVHLACRADSAASTGSVLNADCGIGIRGMGRASGGKHLLEKYPKL